MSAYIHGESDAEADRLIAQAEFLAPFVLPGIDLDRVERLLEPGIGVGAETRLILRKFPSLRVVGIDRSAGQLDRARRVLADDIAAGRVELIQGSATKLPVADGSFDAVLLVWVLEHIPDAQAAVDECARALRPGGRLFATEVYNRSLCIEPRRAAVDDFFAALSAAQARGGGHPDIGARLGKMAHRAGLTVAEHRYITMVRDAQDHAGAVALIRYFEGICRSAEAEVVASGLFPVERVADVWRGYDEICADPDCLFSYTSTRLVAVK